jgi:hypothetical protein
MSAQRARWDDLASQPGRTDAAARELGAARPSPRRAYDPACCPGPAAELLGGLGPRAAVPGSINEPCRPPPSLAATPGVPGLRQVVAEGCIPAPAPEPRYPVYRGRLAEAGRGVLCI